MAINRAPQTWPEDVTTELPAFTGNTIAELQKLVESALATEAEPEDEQLRRTR